MTTTTTTEKNWHGDEENTSCFCSLKANGLETGTNIKMTVFAFWFDSNKELNYPFLGTRVIRGSRFLMTFMILQDSYMEPTRVGSD